MSATVARLQDRAARLLGLEPGHRTAIVRSMLHRPRGDAAGYWLQLVIALALATLGLALDSTAVVIGAMLIAPLMRPIVELAMGLATGSPPLVLPTAVRTVASVAVVVAGAAGLGRLLPFHEVTGELLARTAPTILDLFVAAACALAGAYAVVISTSDVTTTAAGTSIGISLVPPLCTAGYGLSVGDWAMARGAALLFTANVTGIVVVATGLFVLLGFGQVDMRDEERALDDEEGLATATRIGRVVSRRGSRLGAVARVLVPLVLLAGVAFPLVEAVQDMSRRSSIRQRVTAVLRDSSRQRIVQWSLDQSARPTVLRVVLVGTPADARVLEQRLRRELTDLGEAHAAISVWAVSDASEVSALFARLDDVPAVVPAPPPPPEPPPPPAVAEQIRAAWPAAEAGPLVAVWTSDGPRPRVRVTHVGAPLGDAGRALLAHAIVGDARPLVDDDALVPLERDDGDQAAWLARLSSVLARADELPSVSLCVTVPAPPARRPRRPDAIDSAARELVERLAAAHANVQRVTGERWRVVPQLEPCAPAEAPEPTPR